MESLTPEGVLRLRRTYHEVGHAIVAQFNNLPVGMIGVYPDKNSVNQYAANHPPSSIFKRPYPLTMLDSIVAMAGSVAEVMFLDQSDGLDVTLQWKRSWRDEDCGQAEDLLAVKGHLQIIFREAGIDFFDDVLREKLVNVMQDQFAATARSVLMAKWNEVKKVVTAFKGEYGEMHTAGFVAALNGERFPVTLYREQWEKLLGIVPENEAALKKKE